LLDMPGAAEAGRAIVLLPVSVRELCAGVGRARTLYAIIKTGF
jgi:hypothetical protein